jgi:Tetratricopeptide repeat
VAHTTLGIALKAQRKPDEAVAEFRRAIRLQLDEPAAHYRLGIMLKAQGKLADEASNAGFTSSCRKPRFCSVVETLAWPMIILHRQAPGVKKPVGVGFLI